MDLRIVTVFELCYFKTDISHLNLRKSQFLDLGLCNFPEGFWVGRFLLSTANSNPPSLAGANCIYHTA